MDCSVTITVSGPSYKLSVKTLTGIIALVLPAGMVTLPESVL